jgi:DNA-binding NarL/FixJ family response regulator
MTIRIVLADDHPIVLEGVARLVEQEPDLELVARCGSGALVLATVRDHRPDILVLDLRMPQLGGMEVLRQAARDGLSMKTVLLTADIGEEDLLEAVRLGVRGIVLKEAAPDQLVRCIRAVNAGGQWLEQRLAGLALERLLAHESRQQRMTQILSARELELARLVRRGARNKVIAIELGITEGTVKLHLHRIYKKLGVTSRIELANHVQREEG